MSSNLPLGPKLRSGWSARRTVLLATTIFSLGAAAIIVAPGNMPQMALAQNVTQQAQTVARPVGFADVVEKVKPAVISVRVKMNAPDVSMNSEGGDDANPFPPGSPMERFFRRFGAPDGMTPNMPNSGPRGRSFATGQGSGFFISADGFAVTNNHVVDKASSVEITTDDGKTYNAKVIGTDSRTDLALIKVDGRTDFPFAKLADGSPRIGDWVLAVGNPFGLGGTDTAGIVSARGRDIGAGPYDDFIQIDAPVNKGNSGGPTFDVDGSVVGVNTAIFSPSGGSVGIAFAIPADTVKSVIAQLRDKGTVSRGWIGVEIQPVTADIADSLGLKNAEGALVANPQPNGPAVNAGIESGDVITAVNGSPVKDARDLAKKIGAMTPGTSAKLTVMRGGSEKSLTMTLGELPKQREARADTNERVVAGSDVPKLGLSLAPATRGGEGAVITQVDPSGLAAEHGFKTGDVILEIAGSKVISPSDVSKHLDQARTAGKRTVLLRVKSGDATRFVALPLGRA